MQGGLFSLMDLLTVVEGALQLFVALLPLAVWQRTRGCGLRLIAAGFGLGAMLQFASFVVFRSGDVGSMEVVAAWRLVALAATGLVAIGFWQLYSATRAAGAPPAPAATGAPPAQG